MKGIRTYPIDREMWLDYGYNQDPFYRDIFVIFNTLKHVEVI